MRSRVKNIKYIGKEDVYNMQVDKYHNFSVNGGYIAHNCDCLRYGIVDLPDNPDELIDLVGTYFLNERKSTKRSAVERAYRHALDMDEELPYTVDWYNGGY